MYNLIRFYNQNRKKIFKIILIIVFIIGMIQLLNYFAKNPQLMKNNGQVLPNNIIVNNNKVDSQLVSDKSLISGERVPTEKLETDSQVIEEFIEYCNNKEINEAYELLTNSCKEVMFPTIQDFYNIYYMNIFNEEKRIYTIQNWSSSIYQVRFTEDILSSGKLYGNETKQDYISIKREDGKNKVNINSYIERYKTNRKTEYKDIEITVTSIDRYMDYEVYNLSVKNNSEDTILLDTYDDTTSIYLLDNKGMKYYSNKGGLIENKLIVEGKFTNTLQIKFNNSFSSSREIKNLVFSKLVLNYNEYLDVENKAEYQDFYRFAVNV